MALQEAGGIPPRAQFVSQDPNTLIQHYTWNPSTERGAPTLHFYWYESDQNGHRVNMALLSRFAAEQVHWIPNPFGTDAIPGTNERPHPAIGIRFANTVYFSVHALSGSGNDARGLLQNVSDWSALAGLSWAVMGDFNREPENLTVPNGSRIVRPCQTTYFGSDRMGEYDYMVTNDVDAGLTGRVVGGISSDHAAVAFGTGLRVSFRPRANTALAVDLTNGSSVNGMILQVYADDHANNPNQQWYWARKDGYWTLKSGRTSKCIDVKGGLSARPGAPVQEWDCAGQQTQRWQVISTPEAGTVALQNQ